MAIYFVRDFVDLIQHISDDPFGIFMDSEYGIFDRLMIQPLTRNVNGLEQKFIGINVIELKRSCQGLGAFSQFVNKLGMTKSPIMLYDIINDRLYDFLKRKGYESFTEHNYNTEIKCLYKL